jgi:hypothetical protein
MGSRASLDDLEKKKIFSIYRDLNPGSSNPSLIFVQLNITDRADQQPPLFSMNLLWSSTLFPFQHYFTLEQATKAHTASRAIALFFL